MGIPGPRPGFRFGSDWWTGWLEDNLGALEVEITGEDRKRLDAVADPGAAVLPNYYQADFGPHQHRW